MPESYSIEQALKIRCLELALLQNHGKDVLEDAQKFYNFINSTKEATQIVVNTK